jgi:hypothetical protein
MRHYNLLQWTDYTRGVIGTEERGQMDHHLAEGCRECGDSVIFLRQLAQTAAGHKLATPPAYLTEAARHIFTALSPKQPSLHPLQRLAACLVFDSCHDLSPVGARSIRATARQMMYEAEEYCLDLRAETGRESIETTLVGQIADKTRPEVPLASLPVTVVAGKRIVHQTHSNQQGEFCFQFVPRGNLTLCVHLLAAGKQMEVSLSPLLTSGQ